jgi:hypothetical protein
MGSSRITAQSAPECGVVGENLNSDPRSWSMADDKTLLILLAPRPRHRPTQKFQSFGSSPRRPSLSEINALGPAANDK